MSWESVEKAFDSPAYGTHKLVLLAYAHCLPRIASQQELERLTGLATLTVRRAISELRVNGHLDKVASV